MSWSLALDSSADDCSLALGNDQGILFETVSTGGQRHHEELARLAKELLQQAGIEFPDLNCLIFGNGPGSFTGLRIGLAFLKGISYSLQIPLFTSNSLQAYSKEFESPQEKAHGVLVVSDARRDEYFSLLRTCRDGNSWKSEFEPQILSTRRILQLIDKQDEALGLVSVTVCGAPGNLWLANPQLSQHGVQKSKHIARSLLQLNSPGKSPDSYDLLALAQVQPLYLRAVSAKTIQERKLSS